MFALGMKSEFNTSNAKLVRVSCAQWSWTASVTSRGTTFLQMKNYPAVFLEAQGCNMEPFTIGIRCMRLATYRMFYA
jgi:hypothetical protein